MKQPTPDRHRPSTFFGDGGRVPARRSILSAALIGAMLVGCGGGSKGTGDTQTPGPVTQASSEEAAWVSGPASAVAGAGGVTQSEACELIEMPPATATGTPSRAEAPSTSATPADDAVPGGAAPDTAGMNAGRDPATEGHIVEGQIAATGAVDLTANDSANNPASVQGRIILDAASIETLSWVSDKARCWYTTADKTGVMVARGATLIDTQIKMPVTVKTSVPGAVP